MKNVTAHIKALRHHINAKEAELYIKAEKWKSTQTGSLYKWQNEMIESFIREKALINTICESWEELRDHILLNEHSKKLDLVLAETRVMLINNVLHEHFKPLFDWLKGVEQRKEKEESPPEELAVYMIIDEITEIIQTQNSVRQYSNRPQKETV